MKKVFKTPKHSASKATLNNIPLMHEAHQYAEKTFEALTETLWPTRCAVCDTPGELLCLSCQLHLPYIDWWRACPFCGSPFGKIQCCECNNTMLALSGRSHCAHNGCVSAFALDDGAARIVHTWKDAGERRLSHTMAQLMSHTIPPLWISKKPLVVPIPASIHALKRRGFDHGNDLAQKISELLDLPMANALTRPNTKDQRTLRRKNRLHNMQNSFAITENTILQNDILIVDDVRTTGATIDSAADALRQAGAKTIYCLTFARA